MSGFCEWYNKIWVKSDSDKNKGFVNLGNHIKSCPQCLVALDNIKIDPIIEFNKKRRDIRDYGKALN